LQDHSLIAINSHEIHARELNVPWPLALPLAACNPAVNIATATGSPQGVKINKQGALLVADDVGNTVWQ
jgi:glucose/arabinose dehydrogenase